MRVKRIYDISIPIAEGMPVYPGDPNVEIISASSISEGAGANVSILRFGSHTGTHVDPPHHFVDGGATVDQLPLDVLIGECLVCDMGDLSVIRAADIASASITPGTERVLFRTRNSGLWREPEFRTDYTSLDPEAAGLLVEMGVRLVGVDYLSVEGFHSAGGETHRRLLESGVIVVEGLDLHEVSGGKYTLVCLPLRVLGGDGAPARAVLLDS